MTKFLNPYHFVPSDAGKRSEDMPRERMAALKDRQVPAEGFPHLTHDRYVGSQTVNDQSQEVYSGRLLCRLTTETPLVVGAKQTRVGDDAATVEPYRLPNGSPAIPGSSLRGLIGSVLEAATNSALRVLTDAPYSYRAQFGDGLSAIGMIMEEGEGDRRRLLLRPLTLPVVDGQSGSFPVPAGFEGFHPNLAIYIEGYQERTNPTTRRGSNEIEAIPGSFLDKNSPPSYSADNRGPETAYWYLPLGIVRIAQGCLQASHPRLDNRLKRFLIGQYSLAAPGVPLSQQEYDQLHETDRKKYTRGILRVLGVHNREKNIPCPKPGKGGKKHEIFVPYPCEVEGNPLLDAAKAVETFHRLADWRTDDDPALPYSLAGSARNAAKDAKDTRVRLRQGDLVYFRLDKTNSKRVAELAIASIWRHPAESAYAYFRALSPELLPFHPERTVVTVAEQLLGFVENVHGESADRQALTFAGRLRFADGWLAKGAERNPYYEYEKGQKEAAKSFVLQELSSPKPPCPTFYFKQENANGPRAIVKKDLKLKVHQPQGRKFYLHDPRARTTQTWETQDRTPDSMKRKNRVTPLRAGLTFFFHIDFDNLSRRELALLLYCLRPTPEFRHKLGMGKPLGLGTVRIDPVVVLLVDRAKRYASRDLFGGPRYHTCHVQANADAPAAWVEELPPGRYPMELPFLAASPDKEFVDALVEEVRKDANQGDQRAALEQLGDPGAAGGLPIHYPQTAEGNEGENRFEQERYKWWVNNDKTDVKDRQSLVPLPTDGALPSLIRNSQPSRNSGPGARDTRPKG